MNSLTDYEVLNLFDTYVNSTSEYFIQFVAIYFAYLLAAYLLGNKLNR